MKFESYKKKINIKEVITCVLLIVVGYMTAQLFMRKYNGFRVGGQCPTDIKCAQDNTCEKSASNICNKTYYTKTSNNKSYMCGYGNIGGKFNCHGTSNLVNASCSKCIKSPPPPPPPGGKTPTPGGKTPPPPPTPTPGGNTPSPTVSCSFTGSFDTGVCYLNKNIIDPTDSKYDSECQDCQWYSRWQFYVLSICIIFGCGILGGVIGYNSGKYISYGFGGLFAGIVITVITGLVINYTVGTLTTNKTQN